MWIVLHGLVVNCKFVLDKPAAGLVPCLSLHHHAAAEQRTIDPNADGAAEPFVRTREVEDIALGNGEIALGDAVGAVARHGVACGLRAGLEQAQA